MKYVVDTTSPYDVGARAAADDSAGAGAPGNTVYTNITGMGCGPVFAPEVEALAKVMFKKMHHLEMCDIRAWEELSAEEREDYALVIERVLVEKEAILSFFANDSNVRSPT